MNEYELLKQKFCSLKEMGWVECLDLANFIQLLDSDFAKYGNIKVESKKRLSSYLELFHALPDSYKGTIKKIKNVYGWYNDDYPPLKVFNAEMFHGFKNTYGNYSFGLNVSKRKKTLEMRVYNKKRQLIDSNISWSFDLLENFYQNFKVVILINVQRKNYLDKVYYRYLDMKIYVMNSFEDFLTAITNDYIMVSFGGYLFCSEKQKKFNDITPSFCIKENDFDKVYNLFC